MGVSALVDIPERAEGFSAKRRRRHEDEDGSSLAPMIYWPRTIHAPWLSHPRWVPAIGPEWWIKSGIFSKCARPLALTWPPVIRSPTTSPKNYGTALGFV